METIQIVKQIINKDNSYSYFLNDVCIRKKSFKNYSFYIAACDSFSSNIKSAESTIKFWLKHGSEEMKNRKYTILTIQK